MQTQERVPAGLTPERVGFFTDAVFAIAMTLLVIEIPRPEIPATDVANRGEAARAMLAFFAANTGSFVAYVLAFYTLWNVWRQHHRLFDQLARLSPGMVKWHFPLLLLIGFLPFPTAVLGNNTGNPTAAGLYALGVGGLMVCRAGVQSQALRDGLLRADVDIVEFRDRKRTAWVIAWYFVATVLLSWWTPWIIIAWCAMPVLSAVMHRRAVARARVLPAAGSGRSRSAAEATPPS